jgi:hypothetical protein
MGADPDTQTSMDLRSYLSMSFCWSSEIYRDGAPGKTVGLSLWMPLSTSKGT